MKKAAAQSDYEQVVKCYKLIANQSRMAQGKMKDLLDQGLISHGKFVANQVEFTPNQAVSQIKDILYNSLLDKDVQVTSNYDSNLNGVCVGDVDRIQQVLLNLTSNARKFV